MNGSKTDTKIAIIGTGALACLFGARLSQVAQIRLIGSWQEQIQMLNTNGLELTELDGSATIVPLKASTLPNASLYDGFFPADIAVVLVKSYQTELAAQRIKACVQPVGIVLTLQNGMGNLETLKPQTPNPKPQTPNPNIEQNYKVIKIILKACKTFFW